MRGQVVVIVGLHSLRCGGATRTPGSSLSERKVRGSVGEGKSGMFFWFSDDGNYVIKTLKGFEKDFLVTILRDYHAHMTLHRRRTLMCWFFGLSQLEFENKEGKVHKLAVIVMPNSFSKSSDF